MTPDLPVLSPITQLPQRLLQTDVMLCVLAVGTVKVQPEGTDSLELWSS